LGIKWNELINFLANLSTQFQALLDDIKKATVKYDAQYIIVTSPSFEITFFVKDKEKYSLLVSLVEYLRSLGKKGGETNKQQ